MNIQASDLGKYINNLERLEHLFSMYQNLKYTFTKSYENNLALFFIRRKYKKIYRNITNDTSDINLKSIEEYKGKSHKCIEMFKAKYNLKDLNITPNHFESEYEKVKDKKGTLLYKLYLFEALKFYKWFFRIVNHKIYKRIKFKVLKKVIISPNTDTNKCFKNKKVLCTCCKLEVSFTTAKYHLQSKRHKKISVDDQNVILFRGSTREAESQLAKIKNAMLKIKCEDPKNDEKNYRNRNIPPIEHKEVPRQSFDDDEEEFEDDEGNVFDKKTYFDLLNNGLL